MDLPNKAEHKKKKYLIVAILRHQYKIRRQQNVAFVTGKSRLKVKSAGCIASISRIDGVFSDMRIEKKETSFHERWTSG